MGRVGTAEQFYRCVAETIGFQETLLSSVPLPRTRQGRLSVLASKGASALKRRSHPTYPRCSTNSGAIRRRSSIALALRGLSRRARADLAIRSKCGAGQGWRACAPARWLLLPGRPTGALRCLALSDSGGVYEGVLTVLNSGINGSALQLELTGHEGDRVNPLIVRFDFEKDETLRQRVWSLQGTDRTLMLDVHHKKLKPKGNSAR